MTGFKLRTQLILLIAFLQLFVLGVGVAYLVQIRAVGDLELSLAEDLEVLSRLPKLREGLLRMDRAGDEYLATGDRRRLRERNRALNENLAQLAALDETLSPEKHERLLQELESRFASYVSLQNRWIERKGARGSISRSDAASIAARKTPLAATIGRVASFTDANVTEILARQRTMRRATRATFLIIVCTGIAAGALLGLFLNRFLLSPIKRLQQAAGEWRLGRSWEMPPEPSSLEVLALQRSVAEMSKRLNDQYEELSQLEKFNSVP